MKTKAMRCFAVIAAMTLVLGLVGCGGTQGGTGTGNNPGGGANDSTGGGAGGGTTNVSTGPTRYFKAEYPEGLPDSFSGNIDMNVVFKNGRMYYGSRDENYENYKLYSCDLSSMETTEVWSEPEASQQGETYSVNYISVGEDGKVYLYLYHSQPDTENAGDYSDAGYEDVIAYMVDQWGYDRAGAETDWADVYAADYTDADGNVDYAAFLISMSASYITTYQIVGLNPDGTEIFTYDMGADISDSSSGDGMAVDSNGNLCIAMEQWTETETKYYIKVLDATGAEKGTIDFSDNWINNLVTLADGTIGLIGYSEGSGDSDSGTGLYPLDLDGMKVGKNKIIPGAIVAAVDTDTLLVNSGAGLISYNMQKETAETYLNWMDCNISSSSVSSFGVLEDGSIIVYTNTWSNSKSENLNEIAILHEVSKEEMGDVTYLTVACISLDSTLEEKAIEFNKKHDNCHINITEYVTGDISWEDAETAFNTALATGTDADMVLFDNYAQVLNYSSKGLLTDLYPYIGSDAELSKEDFMTNVLSACEYEGQLMILPTEFSINTVVGKVSDVGDTPGWTFEEMKALLASKPEGTQLFYGPTRTDMLNSCLSLGYRDFINWEDNTCNFNSQEFMDILEFANMFPEEFEWDENVDEAELMHSGQILLQNFYLSDMEQYQISAEVFGEPLTYIGYPAKEGNGAMMSLNSMFGLTKSCENPDLAWEFLREFYLPQERTEDQYWYMFPVRKDDFELMCQEAMVLTENEQGSTWGWGNYEVEIQAATKEQVDAVKAVVDGTTAVSGAVSDGVMAIIEEEAAAYFSGQKTTGEVAEIIQSRMQIYLSETN